MNAFITAISAFLPGEPVENDALDAYLGKVERVSARTRQMILAGNGIQTRYYALDPVTGKTLFTNAQLAAEAVRGLGIDLEALECLCCGTSSPDQLMPGHASMVHGELGGGPCEVVSTSGICLSGITAMKYAALSVASGITENAVATGSELASTYMHQDFFRSQLNERRKVIQTNSVMRPFLLRRNFFAGCSLTGPELFLSSQNLRKKN